ncbi:hypothetical protein RXV94_11650 [Yeosuana sp. MJ-SS3]|uniref:DUF4760 domain-containing protein n=1 Tax=Gilvirhabdus luticola TaxID=3079858 RepID=A0ABU3U8S8_9FLAO|nr:hypothetical protein [Yeosuana sp. MJ-SS3]MDU8886817.1 hypothetical protein [Yeosuana sp. MJ-SS3]
MDFDQIIRISELIASIAVLISLIYLGIQVKHSSKVSSANSRHSISQFALDFSIHKAENADRLAKVMTSSNLTEGDIQFRWWNHMMVFLHAETYFHHYELGLMPKKHWKGYKRYVKNYLESPGVLDFWNDVGKAFSIDFSKWIDSLIVEGSLTSKNDFEKTNANTV